MTLIFNLNFNNILYFTVTDFQTDWMMAADYCQSLGADIRMASVYSFNENKVLQCVSK